MENKRANTVSGTFSGTSSCWATDYSVKLSESITVPTPKKVIYNGRRTIVVWSDDSRTIVRCMEGDVYNEEQAVATAIAIKLFKNKSEFKRLVKNGQVQKTVAEEDYEQCLKEMEDDLPF